MDILIVGGTGNISWRLAEAALDAGWKVTVLNRGGRDRVRRPAPPGCDVILSDINDQAATQQLLGTKAFDAIVDFLCFGAAHAQRAIQYFGGRTRQYLFISTTALYDREIARVPLSEASPLINRGWDYALGKAQAERVFINAYCHDGFPVTILRAAHTYDTIIPDSVGEGDWTNPWRLLNGKPIVIHGDGTTLWTLTHSTDFANGIVEFLKTGIAPGETFQITSDETYTWREITSALCQAIGGCTPRVCYRTTEEIARVSTRLGNGITGHKMWCDIYDNRKFKARCPPWRTRISLEDGMKGAVRYFQSDSRLLVPSAQLNATLDEICAMRDYRQKL